MKPFAAFSPATMLPTQGGWVVELDEAGQARSGVALPMQRRGSPDSDSDTGSASDGGLRVVTDGADGGISMGSADNGISLGALDVTDHLVIDVIDVIDVTDPVLAARGLLTVAPAVPIPRSGARIVPVVSLDPGWRRAADVVLAAVLMLLTVPVALVVGLLVLLDSRGPIVFTQQRVARGGSTFCFYKFRTMVADAPTRFPDLYAYRYSHDDLRETTFKLADDPRLTRVGRWLRRTSLDELPNLVNVLRGDMALVGPRPEIPAMLPYYSQAQLVKFAVRPGVTGLAQVRGRNLLPLLQTIELDCDYVARRSFPLDLQILARTVLVVVIGRGAL